MLIIACEGCQRKVKDIEVIIVRNYNIGYYFEDKIDLKNMRHEKAGPLLTSHKVMDYTYACDLDKEKIVDFLRSARRNRLLSWKDEYFPEQYIHDGYIWEIIIYFTDSTFKEIYGDNCYPETWNEMSDAFEALTGSIITNRWGK